MANSKYEYVKDFEVQDNLMPHTWIVIRIDGRGFTKFSQAHQFEKPNDLNALLLMNASAVAVVEDLADIVFAYGVSDEFSFVLRRTSNLYQRRASKLVSIICSLFASSYVMTWEKYFPSTKLQCAPAFDGRAVRYPTDAILRDYLSWRQVDCHINNQYNTCFWNIVGSGKSTAEAQNMLKGTTADVKNNLLFETFKINYNDLPQIFRKGSSIYRKGEKVVKVEDGQEIKRWRSSVVVEHDDIIRDSFWTSNPHILRDVTCFLIHVQKLGDFTTLCIFSHSQIFLFRRNVSTCSLILSLVIVSTLELKEHEENGQICKPNPSFL